MTKETDEEMHLNSSKGEDDIMEETASHSDDDSSNLIKQQHSDTSSDDDDNDNDDDDESSNAESVESTMPRIVWGILLVPFLLMAIALSVAYVGRRDQVVSVELESVDGGILEDSSELLEHRPSPQSVDRPLTATILGRTTGVQYNVTENAKQQIESYLHGQGLLLNVEIANHAGHALCHTLGHAHNAVGSTPAKDCLRVGKQQVDKVGYPAYYPWMYEETQANIEFVHEYFHYISWRFSHPAGSVQMADTNWEDPRLVSILVVRDPLSRMLAHDGRAAERWPAVFDPTLPQDVHQWWAFARSPYTDNFALRALSDQDCCHGSHTSEKYLNEAKALVERFSIVLDMECLDEGLAAAAEVLELDPISIGKEPVIHKSPRERIVNEDVYQFLRSKNRLDVQLYEWARTRSLVRCDSLR